MAVSGRAGEYDSAGFPVTSTDQTRLWSRREQAIGYRYAIGD